MLATRYVSRNRMSLRKRLSFKRVWHFNTSAVLSDGELSGGGVGDCGSNASLPSVQSHRRQAERSVASWAVCFERLLQDPLGVRYFSEFLKKEFSEENILFWQACEVFSHVSENDKKQLTNRAREIYSSFLSSKATTPVNIDSQAQLADDILNAPRPHMFKEQQLQIFNLMKFDSYTRFLKSRLYQECMLAEVESRPLPEPHHVPASPNSKSSSTTTGSSERSALATPKKDDKKSKSGRSLNEDRPEDHADRQRKGMFFSWSRNRSFGKGPKKRDLADFNYNFSGSNGRRESQGSLSSGTSLDLGTSVKNEGDRSAPPAEKERGGGAGAPLRQCNISLPDGSCCSVPVRTGVSIRELLQGLCEKLCINLAAVDLFLVGGEKPLVLDQDCITLCSRDLRLEKRTLFRLDLVPINRSVGLKAKPTKPVTEVLRPVVAKYGLHLADLVARISGEKEPLDLGLPISNLDGLRVVLDVADLCPGNDKQNAAASKSNAPPSTLTRSQPATGEERRSGKPSAVRPRGENGKAGPPLPAAGRSSRPLPNHLPVPHHRGPDRKSQAKIKIDEAEEFFDLISKAQSNRADDQRGLLNKSDLQLPEFLRLSPPATDQAPPPYGHKPACSAPHPRRPDDDNGLPGNHRRGNHKESGGKDQDGGGPSHYPDASHQSQSSDSSRGGGVRGGGGGGRPRPPAPFPGALPPVRPPPAGERARGFPAPQDGSRGEGLQEEEVLSDLTLVGEGEISSLHLTPLPPAQRQHDRWPSSGTSPV